MHNAQVHSTITIAGSLPCAHLEEVLAKVVLHQSGQARGGAQVGGATLYHHGDEVQANGN